MCRALVAIVGLLFWAGVAAGAGAGWESLGPGGGGWLWSLAIAPDDPGTIYLGCDVGGIYRSADHGRTWDMLGGSLSNRYVQAVAVDPTNPAVVYAGTLGGVCKSTDRGEHWTLKREGFPPTETWDITTPVAAVAVDPSDTSRVLAGLGEPRTGRLGKGSRGGLAVSPDGGESWRFLEAPEDLAAAQVFSIVFVPGAPALVLAATDVGVFRSDDWGETWAASGAGLPCPRVLELAADARQGVFYATFADPEGKTGGVARSDDAGRSWRVVRSPQDRDWDYWRIVADPSRPGTVYVALRAGSGIHRSTDGGESWERLTRDDNVRSAWFYVGLGCTALAVDPRDPRRLYYANDMEIYGTADGGATWDQLCTDVIRDATAEEPALWRGRGIETTCSSAVAVARGYANLIYLGYWDTGLWRTTDGGDTFAWVTQAKGYGKAAAVVVDPVRPWRAWLSYGPNYGPHRLWRTDDYGRDWRLVGYEDTGLPAGAVFSLALDPGSPPESRTLYAPVDGQGVFASGDGGESWRRVDARDWRGQKFTNLVVHPRDPARLFLGVAFGRDAEGKTLRGGVWHSADGGATWTLVGDLPERPRVALAESDPQVVYAAERDYSSVGRGGVYRSGDGGQTWQMMVERLDEGLGNIARTYVAALALDPRDAGTVYATSVDEGYDVNRGKGVFVSRDGGRTWRARNEGLANLNCHDLLVDPNDPDRLYAGTGGNGFYRWGRRPEAKPLPEPPVSPRPPDPLCTGTEAWSCTADKLGEITAHDEGFWWGKGYVLARMDTTGHGARLVARLDAPGAQSGLRDLSTARVLSLRLRGVKADGTSLCISRLDLFDSAGHRLRYEADLLVGPTWTLFEIPLRDWEGEGFDRGAVARWELEFWAPYAEGRPYELAVGGAAPR